MFNNAFFRVAAQQEQDALSEQHPTGAQQLRNAYADVIKAVNALASKLGNMYKGRANAMNRNNHKGKNRKQYNHHKKALKLIER